MSPHFFVLVIVVIFLALGILFESKSDTPPAGIETVPIKTALVCTHWELKEVK